MIRFLFVLCVCFMLLATSGVCEASDGDGLLLARDGATRYVIVPAGDAIPAERTAAKQLQQYLHEVTGATFPIRSAKAVRADSPQILVGAGARVKSLLVHQDWAALGSDGIVIKTVGNRLILAGGRPRGTLYAVFQFLENEVGCRWWTPTASTIPHRNTLRIPSENIIYVPPFRYRGAFNNETRTHPIFATILKENGHFMRQTQAWGGHYTIGINFVHTASKFLPPAKYFKSHPQWYTDPTNNDLPCTASSPMPAAQSCQLDVSNPAVVDAMTKAAVKWIKAHPGAGYVSISQNDNTHYCKGPRCMKLIKEQGSPAAPQLKFVNEVAKRIHAHYPNVKVLTLAYQYTIKPPKTLRPGPNVIIRMAPIHADFGHPINSHWNTQVHNDFLAWAKISPRLFVWNYVTNFAYSMFPHPDWAGLGQDLRFYATHHVTGIFEGGERRTGGIGDFLQLRAWLLGHLMWNPNLDQDQLISEFLAGYYGQAAPYLRQYLDLVERAYLSQHRRLSTFNKDFSFITLKTANQAIGLFEKAEDAVKDQPTYVYRVKRTRLSLQGVILLRWQALQRAAKRTGIAFRGPDNLKHAIADFKQAGEVYQVKDFNTRTTFAQAVAQMSAVVGASAASLPEFVSHYPSSDIIDFLPAAMSLYHKGIQSWIVADPAAADHTAAAAVGNKVTWAVQARLGSTLSVQKEPWHIYVWARLETVPGTKPHGKGFEIGLYDHAHKKVVTHIVVPAAKAAGSQYKRFDLGVHRLHSDMYVWVTGLNHTPNIKRIYISRILFVRGNH